MLKRDSPSNPLSEPFPVADSGYVSIADTDLRSEDELEREAERWSVMQEEGTRKMAFASASYSMRSRREMGAPMRRDPNA